MADDRVTCAALVAYGLAAILTFGPAFLSALDAEKARCKTNAWCMPEEPAVCGAILASAAWPLYWSVQLSRAAKEPKP